MNMNIKPIFTLLILLIIATGINGCNRGVSNPSIYRIEVETDAKTFSLNNDSGLELVPSLNGAVYIYKITGDGGSFTFNCLNAWFYKIRCFQEHAGFDAKAVYDPNLIGGFGVGSPGPNHMGNEFTKSITEKFYFSSAGGFGVVSLPAK